MVNLIGLDAARRFIADPGTATPDNYNAAIVLSPTFIRDYADNPVVTPFLARHGSVFVRRESPELANRTAWQDLDVQ